ncbi:MAG: hypothetical protein HOY76_36270 [Streptomyces sp.]|nr:hypothetical protein [Streptomyces sp.]
MSIRRTRAQRRRHRHLLTIAAHVLRSYTNASPDQVVALAFGRHGLRIETAEALDYLNAARAERGFDLIEPQAATTGGVSIPAQRDGQGGDDA